MDQTLCKLTLISPLSAENVVLDVLLTTEPPIAGFTSFPVDGHGASFERATANERVRGRVKRVAIMAVLPRARVEALLAELEERAPVPHLTYWTEPVESFGRMRHVSHRPAAQASQKHGADDVTA